MGGSLSRAIHAFGGMDLDDVTGREQPNIDLEKGEHLQKSTDETELKQTRSPLRFVHIEKAWQYLVDVCTKDESSEPINIQSDIKLASPVRIVLLDTGVFHQHDALRGRVAKIKNFVPRGNQQDAPEDSMKDINGHGTFSAGLLVGGSYTAKFENENSEEPGFKNGVAPFAQLLVGKVLDKRGHGHVDWLVRGLKWACDIDCLDKRRALEADVICIPGGFPKYNSDLREIIYHAIRNGKVIVCSAAGEAGDGTYEVQYPAKFGDVICVGGQSENGQATSLTPAGREIDFLAPADKIWSASSQDVSLAKCDSSTSYGSAIVAGICALLIAYAEKVGGADLRKLVSHTAVMKELLRSMSSTPQHHDRLAGHGTILPHRLLNHGPQSFLNQVLSMVHQGDPEIDLRDSIATLGPLQPILSNFSTLSVMAAIPLDKDALSSLLKQPIKERVTFKWYELLEKVFTSPTVMERFPDIEIIRGMPDELSELDFSVPHCEFLKITAGTTKNGINLTNIVKLYSKSTNNCRTEKLVISEFRHLKHLDTKIVFGCITPRIVVLPGEVPLGHALNTIDGLLESEQHNVTIYCDKLRISTFSQTEKASEFLVAQLRKVKDSQNKHNASNVKVFISHIFVAHTQKCKHKALLEELLPLCSASLSLALVEIGWINSDDQQCTHAQRELEPILFSRDEDPEGSPEDLPESAQTAPSTPPVDKQTFSIWDDFKAILSDKQKEMALEEFAHRAKPIADALLKGYTSAMQILNSASLSDRVTSLDLRLPHVALHTPEGLDLRTLMPRSRVNIVPSEAMLKQLAMIEEDLRTIALSGVLRALHVKASQKTVIDEIIFPPLARICDLKETLSCSLWRRCQNLYIAGETKFSELLRIFRWLPKGDYPLTVHIEKLRLENSLAGEKARDFDAPDKLQIICYDIEIDQLFFQMSETTVKNLYEICLKLSSLKFITFLHEQCASFLKNEQVDVNIYESGQMIDTQHSCELLANFLYEARQEDIVSGDDAILHLSTGGFKFSLMTSGIGQERYRRAFRLTDTQPILTLPENVYRRDLTNMKRMLSAVKTGKMKTVTVAILGSGINGFHPELNLRLGHVRAVGRDKNCPFGESIIGLSFNPVPKETMETFLNQESNLGTLCAGVIAGKTKGAAPFANIVSIKVTNSSDHTKPEYVNAGLTWLLEQERNTYLPESDIVLLAINNHQLSFEMHEILNHMSATGKIVICSTAKCDGTYIPAGRPNPIGYPASLGDVICVGAHGPSGAVLHTSGQGRSIDFTALYDEEQNSPSIRTFTSKIPSVIAAAQAAGVVAYTLAYAEYIGGPSLRRAISNNSVMREVLRQMCTKPAQHDEQSGYGCLTPHQLFAQGTAYFKRVASEATAEYQEGPRTRPSFRYVERGLDLGDSSDGGSVRVRSRSFNAMDEGLEGRRRTRTNSEHVN